MASNLNVPHREPWNKGKIVGQKAPFRIKDIWALRVRLQMESRVRELALFNLGIDSKLRGCDLVSLKVRDVCHGDQVATRAVVMQHKTQRPVQFEITPVTREAVQKWIKQSGLRSEDFLFPSRVHASPHLGTRQYSRILEGWVAEIPPIGLLPHRSTRTRPHLYSEDEIRRLLDAALELPVAWPSTSLRPWVFYGLIGLLSVTGMRLSEALNLQLADVDLDQAVLTIRGAKFGQWRLVPIHPSTRAILADYLKRREQFFRHPVSTYVFVSRRGTRLDGGHVHRTFYTLSRSTGLRAVGASKGPRLHDLRHLFAVKTLTRWYQSDKDPGREMPLALDLPRARLRGRHLLVPERKP